VLSVVCLGGVLVIWLSSPAAARHALFAPRGAEAALAAALLVTVGASVAVLAAGRPPGVARWLLALLIALVAGVVAVMAIASLVAPVDVDDVGVGLLLACGAVGMNVVAARVARW
jgi:hypothetical protein